MLDRRWQGRVFSVGWGPWSGTGMVSNLETHLKARGIALIEPQVGAEHLIRRTDRTGVDIVDRNTERTIHRSHLVVLILGLGDVK